MGWWQRSATTPRSARTTELSGILSADWLRKLDRLQIVVARPTTIRPGATPVRSADSAQGFEVHGYRPYTWGDDLRFLDWNAYARLGEPVVRRFRAERESTTYVLVDASHSMAAPGPPPKFPFAQQLAAALAYLCLRRHEPVSLGALAAGAPRSCRISPLWSHRQRFPQVLQFLRQVEARGPTVLREGVAHFVAGPLAPGVVFVVSDFLLPPEEAEAALAALKGRRLAVVALHVVSEADRRPPLRGGRVRLQDAESGAEQEIHWNERAQALYEQAWQRHLAAIREVCVRHGVTHVPADASAGIERCLFDTLTQAGILR